MTSYCRVVLGFVVALSCHHGLIVILGQFTVVSASLNGLLILSQLATYKVSLCWWVIAFFHAFTVLRPWPPTPNTVCWEFAPSCQGGPSSQGQKRPSSSPERGYEAKR